MNMLRCGMPLLLSLVVVAALFGAHAIEQRSKAISQAALNECYDNA
jgi:hypothetical protein